MRAYELQGDGIESLAIVERPSPHPGPGEVMVRIRAASLNYRDLLVTRGNYSRGAKRPLVPLSDGAGEVVALGEGVTELEVGDRVAGNFFGKWFDGPFDAEKGASALGGATDGVLAEEVVFDARAAVKVPEALSYEQAATLPCAGVTAWVGLIELGALGSNESILAMGTGGVSIFALQIAKSIGAKVVLTSSHDEKLVRGKKLGADATINYRTTPDWGLSARALTNGKGVDHILEVGGATTLENSLEALRNGGHLVLVGLLGGERADIEVARNNDREIRVDSVYVGSAAHFRALCAHVESTGIEPVVDRVFDFEQAPQAYEYLQSGAHFGKVVIAV